MTRAEKAADYCIELTESFDGSRILKALNPYDYEIHNFLAYALTVKMLGMEKPYKDKGKYVVRSLINLDSYQHWFRKTDTRPDFMLIEIPVNENLYNADKPLEISIKIIECKMSVNIDAHLEKATDQLLAGLNAFRKVWNPQNTSINRRYWFTQLYRAIAFSVLAVADNDSNYLLVNSKFYNILNGDFIVNWSGDVYAFDLKGEMDCIENIPISNEIECETIIHKVGQVDIQHMLIPSDDGEPFEFIEMEQFEKDTDETDDESSDNESVTSDLVEPMTEGDIGNNENSETTTTETDATIDDTLSDNNTDSETNERSNRYLK